MSDESSTKFVIGDVVRVKGGGPKMTVETTSAGPSRNMVGCVWFPPNGQGGWGDIQRKAFDRDVLVKAEASES